jgi:hypothetical protein
MRDYTLVHQKELWPDLERNYDKDSMLTSWVPHICISLQDSTKKRITTPLLIIQDVPFNSKTISGQLEKKYLNPHTTLFSALTLNPTIL